MRKCVALAHKGPSNPVTEPVATIHDPNGDSDGPRYSVSATQALPAARTVVETTHGQERPAPLTWTSIPVEGGTAVLGEGITITFSAPIAIATFTFSLQETGGGEDIILDAPVWSAGNTVAYMYASPPSPLQYGTAYTLTLTAAADILGRTPAVTTLNFFSFDNRGDGGGGGPGRG